MDVTEYEDSEGSARFDIDCSEAELRAIRDALARAQGTIYREFVKEIDLALREG